jgi:hypothetical protein
VIVWSKTNRNNAGKVKSRPTQRAPDGWDSARFLELVLNFGRFPFPSFSSPVAGNVHRYAAVYAR